MRVEKIQPIGLCGGVINAINIAKETKKKFSDKNIYIFGMLVHNEHITSDLKKMGIETIFFSHKDAFNILNNFTNNDIIIFSAHGHPKNYETILKNKGITYIDATCNRISNMIDVIKNFTGDIIFIGNKKHAETIACSSFNKNVYIYDPKENFDFDCIKNHNVLVLNQTTLSSLDIVNIHKTIKEKIPNALIYNKICDVVSVRQNNIFKLPDACDLIIIVGSQTSSNTTKLYELAKYVHKQKDVFLIDNVSDIKTLQLSHYNYAILLSGTSTPIYIVNQIEDYLLTI